MATAVNAALKFAETVNARDEILEGLLHAVYDASRRSWDCHERLQPLPPIETLAPDDPNYPAVRRLEDAKAIAEGTAQDGALALMLITDYAIRRYGKEAEAEDSTFVGTHSVGAVFRNGVTFNKAVWALANQARHYDRWITLGHDGCLADKRVRESYITIQAIGYSPLELNAAREFVANTKNGLCVNVRSYADYKKLVLSSIPATVAAQAGIRVLR